MTIKSLCLDARVVLSISCAFTLLVNGWTLTIITEINDDIDTIQSDIKQLIRDQRVSTQSDIYQPDQTKTKAWIQTNSTTNLQT